MQDIAVRIMGSNGFEGWYGIGTGVLAFIGSMISATLMYYLIEKPGLKLKKLL